MAWSGLVGEELRVVLLGNVGSGKSASGNTLLGTSHFACKLSACPVTQQCEAKTVNRAHWRITVVDTPGLTAEIVTDKTKEKLLQCLQLSAPGPHVFLLVIPLGRFTQEEKDTVQRAAQLFKEHFYTFTIILFTFKDNLKNDSISDYISTAGESLQQLMRKCRNRCHAFNNNNPTEDDQAEQLLRKMNSLVQDNFRTYYTLNDSMRERRMRRERERRMRRARLRHLGLSDSDSDEEDDACSVSPFVSSPIDSDSDEEDDACSVRAHSGRRHFVSSPIDSDSDEEDDACSVIYSQVSSPPVIYSQASSPPVRAHFGRRHFGRRHFVGLSDSDSDEEDDACSVDLKKEFEKLKIRGSTEENLKKQAEILDKWKEQLESKEKQLKDREEQVRKQEDELEEKKKKLKEHLQELSDNL